MKRASSLAPRVGRVRHASGSVWRVVLGAVGMLAFVGASLVAGAIVRAAPAEPPPNFLFVLIDNLGKDWFGCYGSDEGRTPHIDSLAAGGVRFRHCYVTPLCSTTRAALLTGRYGFRTGWKTHHDTAIYGGGYFDWERETTFARMLQGSGYATAITGKWQINDLYDQTDALERHGFDEHLLWTGALIGSGTAERRWKLSLVNDRIFENRYWDPVVFRNRERLEFPGRYGPDLYVEYLIDFMGRHRGQPFLAVYTTPMVHVPVVRTPLAPEGELSERELFGEMVRYVDQEVGQLVAALDRLRLRENTVVIVMTDNGSPRELGGRVDGSNPHRRPGARVDVFAVRHDAHRPRSAVQALQLRQAVRRRGRLHGKEGSLNKRRSGGPLREGTPARGARRPAARHRSAVRVSQ